jgi:hypothetical protein
MKNIIILLSFLMITTIGNTFAEQNTGEVAATTDTTQCPCPDLGCNNSNISESSDSSSTDGPADGATIE